MVIVGAVFGSVAASKLKFFEANKKFQQKELTRT